jgi:mono/diheme cytochrome c family protein
MKRALSALALLTFSPVAAPAQDAALGAEYYAFYCATCHGITAEGDGPMAPSLVVQPTDLTALAAGNDGVFPVARVVGRIDGRDPLMSHGSEMPVWGPFFTRVEQVPLKAASGQPILTSPPIADLVAYLETVQD